MSHSITIDNNTHIENLNHLHDFHIYFSGGCITFNEANGPLRFWHGGELVCIETEEDIHKLKEQLWRKKMESLQDLILQRKD